MKIVHEGFIDPIVGNVYALNGDISELRLIAEDVAGNLIAIDLVTGLQTLASADKIRDCVESGEYVLVNAELHVHPKEGA